MAVLIRWIGLRMPFVRQTPQRRLAKAVDAFRAHVRGRTAARGLFVWRLCHGHLDR